jgi:hypothetical protein
VYYIHVMYMPLTSSKRDMCVCVCVWYLLVRKNYTSTGNYPVVTLVNIYNKHSHTRVLHPDYRNM